jgi:hippurate hydrolase
VIAERVVLRGTCRTLDAGASKRIEDAVRRIAEGIAGALRLTCEIAWTRQAPVLRNDPVLLGRVLDSARAVAGADKVVDLGPASMGSEDFAWFGEHMPLAHLKIGSKIDGLDTAIHRSNYDCNEQMIPLAIRAVTRAVLDLLEEQ